VVSFLSQIRGAPLRVHFSCHGSGSPGLAFSEDEFEMNPISRQQEQAGESESERGREVTWRRLERLHEDSEKLMGNCRLMTLSSHDPAPRSKMRTLLLTGKIEVKPLSGMGMTLVAHKSGAIVHGDGIGMFRVLSNFQFQKSLTELWGN